MSLDTNLQNFATRVATEAKSLRTLINGNLSDLSGLTTTAKTNLVAAINEVKSQASAIINDSAASTSTTQTYSASKINSVANAAAQAVYTQIVGGASAAYDTLIEIQQILQGDDASIASIMTALGLRLRVDVNNQGLTATQQQNGRTNLDVYGTSDIGSVTTNYVTVFNNGLT